MADAWGFVRAQGQYELGVHAYDEAKRLESDEKNRQTVAAKTASVPQAQPTAALSTSSPLLRGKA